MANLFVAGQSANPAGRPRGSARSVKGMVDRFIRRHCSPTRLGKLFSQLTPKDQAEMLMAMLPYVLSKQSPDALSKEEAERLYDQMENLTTRKHG